MNERDLQLALEDHHADLRSRPAPSALRHKVLAIPTTTNHRWSLPLVPEGRFELPRPKALDPKSSASASSATIARC